MAYGSENEFISDLSNDEILMKHVKLLNTLANDERVFNIGKDLDTYYLVECCDNWFRHDLSKQDCLELSTLFKEISDKIGSSQ